MATAMGSATTTTYGSQTTVVPISVDRYDFLAVYLVKVRSIFGAQFRNLTATESQQVGTVNGVVLTVVINGTPAASVGFLPGDIITKVKLVNMNTDVKVLLDQINKALQIKDYK